jgi:hypothetical protein
MNRSLALLLGIFAISMSAVLASRFCDSPARRAPAANMATESVPVEAQPRVEPTPQPRTPETQLEAVFTAIWLETPTAAVFFDKSRGDLLVEGLSHFTPALAAALSQAELIKRGRLESEGRWTTVPSFRALEFKDDSLARLDAGFGFTTWNTSGTAFARQHHPDRNQTNVCERAMLHPVVRPGHDAPTVLSRPNRASRIAIRLPSRTGR